LQVEARVMGEHGRSRQRPSDAGLNAALTPTRY
jgi:hypothetical protein